MDRGEKFQAGRFSLIDSDAFLVHFDILFCFRVRNFGICLVEKCVDRLGGFFVHAFSGGEVFYGGRLDAV